MRIQSAHYVREGHPEICRHNGVPGFMDRSDFDDCHSVLWRHRAPPRWRRQDLLIASAVFGVIGASLILLAPAKQLGERRLRKPCVRDKKNTQAPNRVAVKT
jgi:hypothetical protein